jgi:GntR family transcriptional regulator/MocR family aminotransferase
VEGIAAGLHAIVMLPERHGPPSRLLAAATAAGLRVRPLVDYRFASGEAEEAPEHADGGPVPLVIGYARLSSETLTAAVRLLATTARRTA